MGKKLQIQYVPWQSQCELLQVRRWLFPSDGEQDPSLLNDLDVEDEQGDGAQTLQWSNKRKACDTISAWKTRPPLPHAIESTWLITEAVLADIASHDDGNAGRTSSTFSIKAGYITALTRFVTALLDASQTSKYKVSMYAKATEVGLPAMFVDLRHEATHGEVPSLVVLREAAGKALAWLKEYYWDGIGDGGLQGDMKLFGRENDLDAEDDMGDVEPWQELIP